MGEEESKRNSVNPYGSRDFSGWSAVSGSFCFLFSFLQSCSPVLPSPFLFLKNIIEPTGVSLICQLTSHTLADQVYNLES